MAATQDGDIETVLSLMTEDFVFLVPGQQPFGKDVFRTASEKMKAGESNRERFEGAGEIEELIILDNWAFARARLEVRTISGQDSEASQRSVYTLSIFRKGQGKWRLARNANLLA